MEVLIPSHQSFDFDFNSARSSPRRLGDYYFSAPTSPSHISQFYREFDEWVPAAVPFRWEEKPGVPKSSSSISSVVDDSNGDDFAFAFDVMSQDWETASVPAEELFDGGVIKPLQAPKKQRSQARRMIQGAFSPRQKAERGRERGAAPASRRAARSLSPMRDQLWGEEEKINGKSSSVCPAPSKGQKKWSLKDFFLFRSASEGRASEKDPLKKYTAASRRSSFRVIDNPGSGPGSRRKGPVSAHELHYTMNRAVSEDLKKKTFLPYKQGILGRLAFNPAVHALANGFGLSRN